MHPKVRQAYHNSLNYKSISAMENELCFFLGFFKNVLVKRVFL